MSETIINEEDVKILEQIYVEEEDVDILDMLFDMDYEINGKLVEEVINIHNFDILEIRDVTMQFFTLPEEKRRFGKLFITKIHETFGGFYNSIAFAYNIRQHPKYYQERENLIQRRLTVPVYVRDILIRNRILNCVSYEEIEEYSFFKIQPHI